MIGGGYPAGGNAGALPVVAPALVLVGTLMIGGVREIAWDDPTEAIPAFLTMIMMPLTVSITDGIAFGFIAYAVLKLATGRGARHTGWSTCSRRCSWRATLFLDRQCVSCTSDCNGQLDDLVKPAECDCGLPTRVRAATFGNERRGWQLIRFPG